MPRKTQFAVVRFTWIDFGDGEGCEGAECLKRFDTLEDAETYVARRFAPNDETIAIVED